MFERILSIIKKEFIQVFRDNRMKAVIFIAPLFQLLIFGYAVNMDVKHISTAFYDMNKTYESRSLASDMTASGYFNIKYYPASYEETSQLIDQRKVICAVCVDKSFSKDIKKGARAKLMFIFDGTDSNTTMIAVSYIQSIIAKYSADITFKNIKQPPPAPLDVRLRTWYNPNLITSIYNVPGVMAMLIMIVCLLLTAMAIVREREIGTMEQIMVSPIKPLELILGKTTPFAIIALFDMLLVAVVGVNVFHVPIRGQFYILFLGACVYIASAISLGLFLSTIAKTQQQAMMSTFIIMLPAILLSGFVFPIENMPQWVQYITYLNPLRYFLVIIRGVFLKGNGFDILWPQFAALIVMGTALLTLSSLRFKKHI